MSQLDKYPLSGHSSIIEKHTVAWYKIADVLSSFGKQAGPARKRYRNFIVRGVDEGRRADLTGGGLIRSAVGWAGVKEMRKIRAQIKSDERILGDSDFVSQVLSEADEVFERKYKLKARGVDIDCIAARVASLLGMAEEDVWLKGRYRHIVTARSLICFLAVRELDMSMTALAQRFGVSTAAVSKSVKRGREIFNEKKLDVNKLRVPNSPNSNSPKGRSGEMAGGKKQ